MARLNVEVIPPNGEQLNQIFDEISRKYAGQRLTEKTVSEIERETARLVRRMIQTKITFVGGPLS